ncbi:VOC family protein [Motilimonas cestriensis]|uniref:VOC family protein n=1 Tax=Motilimonas cestriensis TaxID=2742685 RepID=UPI003DA3BB17
MHNIASIFEIPATDLDRAVKFYGSIFALTIETMDMPGMRMGIFPYEDQATVGVIVQGEGYLPSSSGITLYLNAGEDLQLVLSKVEANGGKILAAKTPHADESGFFALFLDTEGNRLGLHSPK